MTLRIFWVSYETAARYELNVVFFDMEPVLNRGSIQQVGRGCAGVLPSASSGTIEGNIFEAPSNGSLTSVNIYSSIGGLTYTVDIYRNIPEGGDPDDGDLVASSSGLSHLAEGCKLYPGYEAISLSESVALEKGERYSVIVALRDRTGRAVSYREEQSSSGGSYLAPLAVGESFCMVDGSSSWQDLRSKGVAASIRAYFNSSVEDVEHSGDSRYETAASAVSSSYPNGSPGVIIASGENFPDALSASGLSGALGYPILLTARDALPASVENAISDLQRGRTGFDVLIAGGDASVSEGVERQLAALCGPSTVRRIFGDTRFETNALLNKAGNGKWGETAILCTGSNYPDALSISSYAYAGRAPVYLVGDNGSLSQEAIDAIKGGGFARVVIIGGSGAVPSTVMNKLGSFDYIRVAGADRYQTSIAAAAFAADEGVCSWGVVGVATGESFPDALAGGPVVGAHGGLLLLASPSDADANAVLADSLRGHDV